MSSDLFFTSSEDEDEVNNELAMFTEVCQAAYEASNLKVQQTSIERDRYDAHDHLVVTYFSAHPRKRLTKTRTMTKLATKDDLHGSDNTTHSANLNAKFKIGDEFLKILRDNTFNRVDKGDVIDHMAKVLEISEWIKILNVDHNQIQLHIFPISLSGHAKEWWENEIKGTTITWNELGILTPLQHTFAPELKLENCPEKNIKGVPRSNSISHFL
ncbi:hypothetical protein Tco_0908952 [Tanacetum coccineum]|uniref:Retrotransposon gag domain-containing protein n=1 Tax=Tanacetum coccineum TaxID=301880 RepID=A0ABQ5CQG2_9ASTR